MEVLRSWTQSPAARAAKAREEVVDPLTATGIFSLLSNYLAMNDPIIPENAPEPAGGRKAFRPLRVWPAILLALLMLATRFGPALTEGGGTKYWMVAVFGPLLCCLLLIIWWLAASRATWRERLFGFLGVVAAAAVCIALDHPTMRGAGTSYFTLPLGFLVFALAASLFKKSPPAARTGTVVLLAFAGFAVSTFMRTEGMTGDYKFAFRFRWSQTAEDAMLAAQKSGAIKAGKAAPVIDSGTLSNALAHPEWPEFRGTGRAGRSSGPKISTDWSAHPPQQLWKIQAGPGWSSFAVAGRMLFTQEQRGPKETVVCYDADSGKEIWKLEVDARLEDPMGGPGPRATPTLANGALYVCGSTGAFFRLNPGTGAVVWKKDLTQVADCKVPMWGFSGSPLVVGSVVIVYAGGGGDKGLLAFDTASGDLRWSAPCPVNSYGSPQLNSVLGEDSVLMLTASGLQLLDPANGKSRLEYEWKIPQYRALQPAVIATDTILLPTGLNMGTRAIRLKKNNDQYVAEELWTSRQLKPDFADLVIYQGRAYGNDGGILTCIDLQTGERKWKGGRYGKGQILLLENSGLLLISSEQGQVALVAADAAEYREIASFQALEGKTWNHPVVVNDRLYVRNSQEAAAYKLQLSQ
jgi:outer membrane protein assembly factor BamB